jgi:apolipoprotein N-acyltransferase
VPFGEFAPLGSLGQQINGRLPMARESFVASKSTNLLRCMWGGIGTSICIELVYPHLISDEVRHGAHLLINVSNLGWFHQSSLNKQILAAAILRAVENGRYFVVSANTGISAVIDPSGTVTSVSYPNRRGVLLDTVQFLYNQTPFSKMWWL